MSYDTNGHSDGKADAIAAVAIISVTVFAAYLWLSGLPH